MAPTEALQTKIYDEIVGRIKKDDESVPVLDKGYWYYSRYEEGKEYAFSCRKKGSMDAEEEVMSTSLPWLKATTTSPLADAA